MSSNHEVGNKMPHHSTPHPFHSHTCPTSEANSAKCPRSPLTPILSPPSLCPVPLFHNNLSWGEFDKTKLREPKEPDDAERGERGSERARQELCHLSYALH